MNIKKLANYTFHSKNAGDVIKFLKTDRKGLNKQEAENRLNKFGLNEIPEKARTHPITIFFRQFKSLFVYTLVIAAITSYYINHLIDVYVIISIIILNSAIGLFHEYRAEKAVKALKKLVVQYAKVYRAGELLKIDSKNLVIGDIILLEEGDKVPADGRLIQLKNLKTVESSLTGESLPATKTIRKLNKNINPSDRSNMVWMGTFIARGTAMAVVTGTGVHTAIGEIAQQLGKIEKRKSHFRIITDKLAKQMAIIAFGGASLTFIMGFFIRKIGFMDIFMFTIASIVSGIPEGLPAVLAMVLAIGSRRMAQRNAIVRKLDATETLGIVTTILSDKTGTLTENTINVRRLYFSDGQRFHVTGHGWKPKGTFHQNKHIVLPYKHTQLSKLLHIALKCNRSKLLKNKGQYEILGDPTEAALLVLAKKANHKDLLTTDTKKIDDMPFSSDLKYRASLITHKSQKKITQEAYVIGAPEIVLSRSKYHFDGSRNLKLPLNTRRKIEKQINTIAKRGMRVVALAYKPVSITTKTIGDDDINDLVFVGLAGMFDPPRQEVKQAIQKAKQAGIRIIIATGDHKNTALSISREIGLIDTGINTNHYPLVVSEKDLKGLSQKQFDEIVCNVNIFCRLTPRTKSKIAKSLQRQGEVVAMTGDGVNDGPALKRADVGISMGIVGTDVARESSEIILANDNFASIVNAVEEGRIVFRNIRQTSFFLITTNFAENAVIFITLALGNPLPLLPTQVLWLNLVTDGFPNIALATEKGHNDILSESPKKYTESILTKEIFPFLGLMVLIMGIITLLIFNLYIDHSIEKARTGAFVVMGLTQVFNTFNMRSLKKSVFQIGFLKNKLVIWGVLISITLQLVVLYLPITQNALKLVALPLKELALIVVLSSIILPVGEAYKYIKNKYYTNHT